MNYEIKFLGETVKVHKITSQSNTVKFWDEIDPDSVHSPTRLTWKELKELGEGTHDIGDE